MAEIKFSPVEVSYRPEGDRNVIELYGRTSEGKQVCVQVRDFVPYFWVTGDGQATHEKIAKVESHRKKLLGKEIEVRKVFVRQPKDVPVVREKFETLEADVPFTRRYLIDRKVTPLKTYRAEGEYVESSYKVDVFAADSIAREKFKAPEVKILAVDIETHTQFGKDVAVGKDPIIMIALYGKGMKKVLTWKSFDGAPDYVECLDSEIRMMERFRQLVEEFGPDVLTGYFSDRFDLPYVRARAEKFKAKMGIGLDRSGFRTKKGNMPVTEITGIAHVDIFRFVKRIFRTSFTSFKLDHVAKEILGEEKTDVNLEDLYGAWQENRDLEKFAKYNLQDAKLAHDLCLKLMPNLAEFTRLIGLTPSELSRMSFSQLVEWYLMSLAPDFNELAPNRPDFREERGRRARSYEGASVFEPTPGLYKDVAVFDFMSLYPTIISSHNVSPDTLVKGRDSEDGVLKGISFDKEKKGFIGTVIRGVIERRLKIKKLSKENPGDLLLHARQDALKTIANSIYGYYGFFGARWYSLECAQAITAYGRHHIDDVITKAQEAGLKVLYSDTDSVFIALNGKEMSEVMEFVNGINAKLPGIMGLEYEGLYRSGIFVGTKGAERGAKKRYALLSSDGKMKVKGFETVRRNLSKIAKETQEKALNMILTEKDAGEVADYVKGVVRKLREKKVENDKVIIATQISRDLRSYDNVTPHVAAAERMKKKGHKVTAGTGVRYVVTEGRGPIRDRIKLPEEIEEGEYDPEYYVSNQVVPAVGKLLEVMGYDSSELAEEHRQKKLESFFG